MRKPRSGGPKPKPANERKSKTLGQVALSPDELEAIKANHQRTAWSEDARVEVAGLGFAGWVRAVLIGFGSENK